MRRLGAFAAGSVLLLTAAASARAMALTLPELFQKAKAQIRGEAWAQALQTLDALEVEAGKPGNEGARQQLAAPLAFYRGVCDANLGRPEEAREQFAAFLGLEPNASMDPSMYSKKAIAAFNAARREVALEAARMSSLTPPTAQHESGPSVFQAFQEFRLPVNSGEQVNAAWADGPVKWIMTADERRRWSELMAGADWQDFADHFWEVRNPQPGNPDNVYKTTFDRRVAFADTYFVSAEGTRGSMTDRGMVFVLLGPPTYVGRKPIRSGEDVNDAAGLSTVGSRATAYYQRALTSAGEPAGSSGVATTDAFFGPGARAQETGASWREVWHYRRELLPKSLGYQQVDVEFITRRGYGVAVLQRDPMPLAALDAARSRIPSAP
jgi:GWxTD domain-containing protein